MITQQSPGHSLAAHPGDAPAVPGHARLPPVREVPVSATLAANEAVAARRARLLMDRYGVATLPWIAAALARLEDILTDLAGPANVEAATRERTTLRSGTGQA